MFRSSYNFKKYCEILNVLNLKLFLVACSDFKEQEIEKKKAKTISVNLNIANEKPLSSLFSEIKYVTLKTSSENKIGRIVKIDITNNYILLLDDAKKRVWIFTREGSLINFISIPDGRGPGEVNSLFDFAIDGDNKIHAIGRFKMVVYELDGTLVNEFNFKYPGYKFTYFNESDIYGIYTYGSSYQSGNVDNTGSNIIFINSKGELEGTALPTEILKRDIKIIVPDNFPSYDQRKLFFAHPDPVIYEILPTKLIERYRLDFGEHNVPPETYVLRENYDSEARFIFEEIINKGYATFILRALETDKWAVFSFQVENGINNYAFYNKTQDTTLVVSGFQNDIDFGLSPFFEVAHDNKIYAVIQPHDLLERVKEMKQDTPELLSDQSTQPLLALADSLSSYDNPIIMELLFNSK